ncbi:MAG: LysR family transcriptional regulator [Rhodospirillaceae bacterium]|nr:LysR family transcriptional regulator [Rhodospirillaceae bacterium]
MKDLHQLKIFLKVAEVGSVGKASAQLRIAQPALSRQIRLLEEETGTPLFTRQWRGMKLTAAGIELRRSITGAVKELDQALANIRSMSETPSGRVRFGLVSTLSPVITGRIAQRVAAEFPSITLAIADGFSLHLVEWLHRGDLDFAIVCGSVIDLHMSADELLVDELVLIGSPKSGLDPSQPVSVKELAALPLALPSNPNGMRRIIEAAAAKLRVKLDVRFEGDSLSILTALAASGVGHAVVPLSSVIHAQKTGATEVKYAPIVRPKLTKQLILARNSEAELTPSAAKVHRVVREEVARAVRSGNLQGAHLLFDLKKTA